MTPLNPTALRKANTAYNFGHSECNRVKWGLLLQDYAALCETLLFAHKLSTVSLALLHSERPKLFTILAFLSATELTVQETGRQIRRGNRNI